MRGYHVQFTAVAINFKSFSGPDSRTGHLGQGRDIRGPKSKGIEKKLKK